MFWKCCAIVLNLEKTNFRDLVQPYIKTFWVIGHNAWNVLGKLGILLYPDMKHCFFQMWLKLNDKLKKIVIKKSVLDMTYLSCGLQRFTFNLGIFSFFFFFFFFFNWCWVWLGESTKFGTNKFMLSF